MKKLAKKTVDGRNSFVEDYNRRGDKIGVLKKQLSASREEQGVLKQQLQGVNTTLEASCAEQGVLTQ